MGDELGKPKPKPNISIALTAICRIYNNNRLYICIVYTRLAHLALLKDVLDSIQLSTMYNLHNNNLIYDTFK